MLTFICGCVQLGNLLKLKPIDLSAAALPAVGVPPLDISDLLGVQFLGFSIANFSVPDARLSVSGSGRATELWRQFETAWLPRVSCHRT